MSPIPTRNSFLALILLSTLHASCTTATRSQATPIPSMDRLPIRLEFKPSKASIDSSSQDTFYSWGVPYSTDREHRLWSRFFEADYIYRVQFDSNRGWGNGWDLQVAPNPFRVMSDSASADAHNACTVRVQLQRVEYLASQQGHDAHQWLPGGGSTRSYHIPGSTGGLIVEYCMEIEMENKKPVSLSIHIDPGLPGNECSTLDSLEIMDFS